MSKDISFSEKVIATFLIIFGVFTLFVIFYGFKVLYDTGTTYSQLTWERISIWKVFKTYHAELILGMLTIIAGFLLFFAKKSGWILAIISSLVNSIIGLILLFKFYFNPEKPDFNKTALISFVLLIVLSFFVICYKLLSESSIGKYNATKQTWWTIIIVGLLLIIDKILFDLLK